MGIESDQLVYDYLSRVGDLAQQRQLPSGARMRLVADLRNQIDRGRAGAGAGGDSPAAVRRILARLGTPEDIVDAAGETPGTPGTPDAPAAVPPQHGGGEDAAKRLRRIVPRPRRAPKTPPPQDLLDLDDPRPSPPHLAGSDELGPSGSEPDWWRLDSSPFGGADTVPGFVGGVEIPEILKPPPDPDDPPRLGKEAAAEAGAEAEEEVEEVEKVGEAESRRRWRPRLPHFFH
ncbi:HAAS signaling domain-containing protein, partial [Streptomyces alboniger]|uniref:HAAS signaling domain-containing protein n=1 Tax=Streptomyces alboniger TaxID=132473 RepID=UPI000B2B0BD0